MGTGRNGVTNRVVKGGAGLAVVVLAAICAPCQARAEAKEVRIAYQTGLPYLPVHAVLAHRLIEKHAAKAGVGEVRASEVQLSGAAATNDALLSGSVDFVAAGIGGLLQIWDKTRGGLDVRAIIALNDTSMMAITNDPRVKTIKDYADITDHRIGLPAVKVSIQAVVLQMAAEQAFGPGQQARLDPLTVSLPHPEALAALLSGRTEIRTHIANLPFSYQALQAKDKGLRLVFSSYDILGGPHMNIALYNTGKWKSANPKLFKAVFDAFVEAHEWLNADHPRAAKLFKETTRSKLELAELAAMIGDKAMTGFSPAPNATMKFAEFLHKTGSIKNKPTSWKDYFWDTAHHLKGS